MKNSFKNLFAMVVGCLIAVVLLEVFLRIYNPFHFRVRGQQIELRANHEEFRINEWTPKLDSLIVHVKNNLGFRGPNMPDDFDNYLSIITIGGSTTECRYSTEGKDWPAHLAQDLQTNFKNVWLDNAGLDGHSTFGHQVLLNDYVVKIRPKVVLFYVGINDMGTKDLNSFDKGALKGNNNGAMNFLVNHSELANVVFNILRMWRAKKHKLEHNLETDLLKEPQMTMTTEAENAFLQTYKPYAQKYKARLQQLANTCKANGIYPVFMTQPVLYGEGTDDVTGADLENIKVWKEANGKAVWALLKTYNETTKMVAAENQCGLLDIAEKLPKSSRYYYDLMHYSNEGSEKVAWLAWQELVPILMEKFPAYILQENENEGSKL
ncbi:MAG: SGNH/GDSL hydrolase family protein [Lewinellaceae bacterium]|nr:SGNH/GDSL hydrolase family protein [Saprospiraceae bacterium]MCB9338354.1 SGNH/GDSL hydrolase family protein [Lewinellaceae bacterium]